jgi:hypothetical protein
VTEYQLVSEPRADLDIEAAFLWYEKEQSGLGLEFLDELRGVYNQLLKGLLSILISGRVSGERSSDVSLISFTSRSRPQ